MTQVYFSNPSAADSQPKAPTFILVDGHSSFPLVFLALPKGDGCSHLPAFPPVSVFLKSLLEVMASSQKQWRSRLIWACPPSATKPTTPIKQTDQAHRKTSFPI